MATFRTQSTAPESGWSLERFMELLQKYWLVILAAIFIVPYAWRFIKKQIWAADDDEADRLRDDTEAQNQALGQVTSNTAIQNAAKTIYEAFNIPESGWGWLNPGNWTENDEDAFLALMSVSNAGKPPQALHECYRIVSGNRDLQDDCYNYLDDDYYEQINW